MYHFKIFVYLLVYPSVSNTETNGWCVYSPFKTLTKTRKHSGRMFIARLPTVCASVATRCNYWGTSLIMSDVRGSGRKALYTEVQYIMGNGHMGSPLLNRQTDTSENITFLQIRWQAVTKLFNIGHRPI